MKEAFVTGIDFEFHSLIGQRKGHKKHAGKRHIFLSIDLCGKFSEPDFRSRTSYK